MSATCREYVDTYAPEVFDLMDVSSDEVARSPRMLMWPGAPPALPSYLHFDNPFCPPSQLQKFLAGDKLCAQLGICRAPTLALLQEQAKAIVAKFTTIGRSLPKSREETQ
jgi:hypothetical protein